MMVPVNSPIHEDRASRIDERQHVAMEKKLRKQGGTKPFDAAAAARRERSGNKRFTPKAGTR